MGTGISAEPHWTEHPDVLRMVEVAVDKQLRLNPGLLRRHHDIDRATIIQDLWGKCVEAKYNPKKSAPGTFAHGVAYKRFYDILRARNIRIESDRSKNGGVERSQNGDGEEIVDSEEITTLRNILDGVIEHYKNCGEPPRPKQLSPVYPDRRQRIAADIFRRHMGWNFYQAETEFKKLPGLYPIIGLTHTPSYRFFYRASYLVTHIEKIVRRLQRSKMASPE